MSNYHLAQLNIAVMSAPVESPQLKDFVDNLDRVNVLAEQSPGYLWRLQDESGNATALRPFGDDTLVNLSVWENVEDLEYFVYQSIHVDFVKRRREWFEKLQMAHTVLWWIPQGHTPDEKEAGEKLELLRSQGATPEAFTFRERFAAPNDAAGGSP